MFLSTGGRVSSTAGVFLTLTLAWGVTEARAEEGTAPGRGGEEDFPASPAGALSTTSQAQQGTPLQQVASNAGAARYRECSDVFVCFVDSGTPSQDLVSLPGELVVPQLTPLQVEESGSQVRPQNRRALLFAALPFMAAGYFFLGDDAAAPVVSQSPALGGQAPLQPETAAPGQTGGSVQLGEAPQSSAPGQTGGGPPAATPASSNASPQAVANRPNLPTLPDQAAISTPPAAVSVAPEPVATLLLGTGLVGLAFLRYRRRNRKSPVVDA